MNLQSFKIFFQKNSNKILFISFLTLMSFLAYGLYFLFNRPPDPKIEAKIREEAQSVDIKFNTKTIEETKELKNYDVQLNPNPPGKNPFWTY